MNAPDQTRLRQLVDEQASLRRVATLVAGGAEPEHVFTAVADELGHLIGAEATFVSRVDHTPGEQEDYLTVVGSYGDLSDKVPIGFRLKLVPGMVQATALRTGRAARVHSEELAKGPYGAWVATLGMQAGVATPIVVEGRQWGVTVAATSQEDFPLGTESRMADFMELAATAIANARAVKAIHELADAQAALRRVATLVAREAPAEELFAAVPEEAGRLLLAGEAAMIRYGSDRTATVVGSWARTGVALPPVGDRQPLGGNNLTTIIAETGRSARIDYTEATGEAALAARWAGYSAAAGAPIIVQGRLWGALIASAVDAQPMRVDTEARLASFTELVATAIANAQAQQELHELADTQAALRRLATLVARGEAPEAVFAAATKEALRHFGIGTARMIRYELDGTATLVANEGTTGPHVRVGHAWENYPATGLTATVWRTGEAARVDDYGAIPGGEPYLREGLRSAVAVPIHVNGRLWGAIAVGSGQSPQPPGTEQRMIAFTDLVATAVANAQNRAELITSRARIVAAADEARRRLERDLHDGAQQRLVALALRLRSTADAPDRGAEIASEVADVADGLLAVIDELREICHGIHPAVLSQAGLRAALRALGRRSAVPVDVNVLIDGRLPEQVEVGAYYVVSEMLTNAAKHAHASAVEVEAHASGGTLRVCVRDDGVGGADPQRGSGLVGLKDRIDALGGTFSLQSPPGGGTTVCCELPIQP